MKYKLTVFLILFLSLALHAQESDTFLKLNPKWEIGDQFEYQVEKNHQEFNKQKLVNKDSLSYRAVMSIKTKSDSLYIIGWQCPLEALNISGWEDSFSEQLDHLTPIEVLYQTDQFGRYQGIINQEDIWQSIRQIQSIVNLKIEYQDDEKPMVEIDSSQWMQSNFRELYYIHYCFGKKINQSADTKVKDFIPDPRGGKTITTAGTIRINQQKDSLLSLIHESKTNKEDTKKYMDAVFSNPSLSEEDLLSTLNSTTFNISHKNSFTFDLHNNLIVEIKTNCISIKNEGGLKFKQIENLSLKLLSEFK